MEDRNMKIAHEASEALGMEVGQMRPATIAEAVEKLVEKAQKVFVDSWDEALDQEDEKRQMCGIIRMDLLSYLFGIDVKKGHVLTKEEFRFFTDWLTKPEQEGAVSKVEARIIDDDPVDGSPLKGAA